MIVRTISSLEMFDFLVPALFANPSCVSIMLFLTLMIWEIN